MNLSKVEQQRNKKQLLLTSSFYSLLAKSERSIFSKGETTIFDGADPAQLVNELEDIRTRAGIRIHIFDVGILDDGMAWAFIQDSINRSGSNPLRQLVGLSTTRFMDVGQLYIVPEEQRGIKIISLGARFDEVERGPKATCGHLHTIAVIAHAMNFEVSATVFSKEEFKKTSFVEIERLC